MSRWASEPIIALANAPANDDSFTAPVYVGDWWGCDFIFNPHSLEQRLTIVWGELTPDSQNIIPDANSTLSEYSCNLIAGGLAHVVPHLGPYMRIFVETPGLAPATFDLIVRHTNRRTNGADFQEDPLMFINQSIPSGGVAQKFDIIPYVGPAYVSVFSLATGTSNVQIVSHDATDPATVAAIDVAFWAALPQYNTPRRLWLPALCNQIWITNNGAGAINFLVTIIPIFDH